MSASHVLAKLTGRRLACDTQHHQAKAVRCSWRGGVDRGLAYLGRRRPGLQRLLKLGGEGPCMLELTGIQFEEFRKPFSWHKSRGVPSKETTV